MSTCLRMRRRARHDHLRLARVWRINMVGVLVPVAPLRRPTHRPNLLRTNSNSSNILCTLLPHTANGHQDNSPLTPPLLLKILAAVVRVQVVVTRARLRLFHRCRDIRIRGRWWDYLPRTHRGCRTSIGNRGFSSYSRICRSERKVSRFGLDPRVLVSVGGFFHLIFIFPVLV